MKPGHLRKFEQQYSQLNLARSVPLCHWSGVQNDPSLRKRGAGSLFTFMLVVKYAQQLTPVKSGCIVIAIASAHPCCWSSVHNDHVRFWCCVTQALFRRAQLKALVDAHGLKEGLGGNLTHDEITVIRGALDLTHKTAADCMTPMETVRLKLPLHIWHLCQTV